MDSSNVVNALLEKVSEFRASSNDIVEKTEDFLKNGCLIEKGSTVFAFDLDFDSDADDYHDDSDGNDIEFEQKNSDGPPDVKKSREFHKFSCEQMLEISDLYDRGWKFETIQNRYIKLKHPKEILRM